MSNENNKPNQSTYNRNDISEWLSKIIRKTQKGSIKWIARIAVNEEYTRYESIGNKKHGSWSLIKIGSGSNIKYIIKEGKALLKPRGMEILEREILKNNPEKVSIKVKKKTQPDIEIELIVNTKGENKKKKKKTKNSTKSSKDPKRKVTKKKLAVESKREVRERLLKLREEEELRQAAARKQLRIKEQEELAKLPLIDVRDFVVRRSVFKCMHDNHNIENIVAAVNIIDKINVERLAKISAGYCPVCKVYFVMESTYENLRKSGIPICRISDEKTYLKGNSVNGMMLSQESVLMQYGYNVSQNEGLSSLTRQKILAVLIDKKVLSKSEIISYLDFFISQRASQSKYQIAISKWEMDRDFVEGYRMGDYHQFGVNSFYKNI